MLALQNKTILILSPQAWGTMFLSKHHYAIELAKNGNTVYFLNPPDEKKSERKESIKIIASSVHENLFFIQHRLRFPYRIKFHAISVFHWLMQFHINKILKQIPHSVDIVWSFDLGNLYPFRFFNKEAYKIFHPVDEPLNQTAIDSAKGAQVIFSVTREILEKYHLYDAPKHFINHGVSEDFLLPVDINRTINAPIRVGISGNLLRPDIDREVLIQIINENPDVIFEFWGSYLLKQTNIGGASDEVTQLFIQTLQGQKNVILHGAISSHKLAKVIHDMDAFLICYDVQKDQSKGTNYHKVMEYLSTGKVIISNNISTYKNQPFLVQMIEEREHNRSLPILFKKIIQHLSDYNSSQLQQIRISFANENTYKNQVDSIEKIVCGS